MFLISSLFLIMLLILKFMQVIKNRFPEENGYILNTSNRLTFTDFPAYLQFIPEENDNCTVTMGQTEVSVKHCE